MYMRELKLSVLLVRVTTSNHIFFQLLQNLIEYNEKPQQSKIMKQLDKGSGTINFNHLFSFSTTFIKHRALELKVPTR